MYDPRADATALNRIVALVPGQNPYQPSERRQRRILQSDRSRAQVVAGEAAKVSELRKQWHDITVGDNPREFAHFVIRRALLAMERAEYRILGPQYKSPRLVRPEIMASARFRAGLEKIPGAFIWLGVGEEVSGLHTPQFAFDEKILPRGSALLTALALSTLADDSSHEEG